jgi:hypothetical protein
MYCLVAAGKAAFSQLGRGLATAKAVAGPLFCQYAKEIRAKRLETIGCLTFSPFLRTLIYVTTFGPSEEALSLLFYPAT